MDCFASRTKTVGIKKLASGRIFGFAKPAASRLRAEVPFIRVKQFYQVYNSSKSLFEEDKRGLLLQMP